jgi:hypothetical protein
MTANATHSLGKQIFCHCQACIADLEYRCRLQASNTREHHDCGLNVIAPAAQDTNPFG